MIRGGGDGEGGGVAMHIADDAQAAAERDHPIFIAGFAAKLKLPPMKRCYSRLSKFVDLMI
jgi:hypothetical protein